MELVVRESGELQGPVIVFLHGGGVAGWMWEKQMAAFKDYHVLVPDLPAHGQNASVPFESMHAAAEKIVAATTELIGMDKMILVGFSLGAQIAVEIISHWPERVDSAILLSPLLKPFKAKKFWLTILKMTYKLIKIKWFAKLQARQLYLSDEQFERYYDDSRLITKENFLSMMDANMGYSLPEDFKKADMRILALAGAREKKPMKDSVAELVHANRNCIGYQVAAYNHGLPFISPELMNDIASHFINNLSLQKNARFKRID